MDNKLIRYFLYVACALFPFLHFSEKFLFSGIPFTAKCTVFVFTVTVLLCACEDILTRTIPDFFNALIFFSGMTFAFSTGGFFSMSKMFIKSLILFILLFIGFIIAKGGIGGGDIKLISAATAFIGPMNAVICTCQAAMLASPLGITLLLHSAYIRRASRPDTDTESRSSEKKQRTMQPLTLPFGPFYAICILIKLNNMF